MSNANNEFYIHSLHLAQHPIDTMLQFDANANTNANVDASVNGPLNFDSDVDANANADVKCEQSIKKTSYFRYHLSFLMLC